jgi:hypothetical protein
MAAFFALYGMIFKVNSGVGKYINTKIIRAKFVRALFFVEKEKESADDENHHNNETCHIARKTSYENVLSKIESIKFTWRDKFFMLYNLAT